MPPLMPRVPSPILLFLHSRSVPVSPIGASQPRIQPRARARAKGREACAYAHVAHIALDHTGCLAREADALANVLARRCCRRSFRCVSEFDAPPLGLLWRRQSLACWQRRALVPSQIPHVLSLAHCNPPLLQELPQAVVGTSLFTTQSICRLHRVDSSTQLRRHHRIGLRVALRGRSALRAALRGRSARVALSTKESKEDLHRSAVEQSPGRSSIPKAGRSTQARARERNTRESAIWNLPSPPPKACGNRKCMCLLIKRLRLV